ncbi:MAG: AtpZ/AtpI family protein [Candidatus Omnitrophota bacterium]
MPSKEFYKRIKIAGLISYIPVMLAAPALAGFFLGDYLQRRFNLPFYVLIIFVFLGLIIGIRESIRIIRLVLRIEEKK